MEQKIAQLTETIYREGVAKGDEEAKKIIEKSKETAEKILSDAKKAAEKILSDAKEQAEELKKNTTSEIQLSGRQAISEIKQQILDMVTAKVIDAGVSSALSEPAVIKDYINSIVKNWKTDETISLEILLPENRRKELEKSFQESVQKLLKTGVSVIFSKNIKGGFQIGPKGSSYKISLTDEDFSEFFKEYLRPKTRSYLFGE